MAHVSVLMTVYNGGAYLRPALDSIFKQTYADFELIIVDDGSTDGSAELIENLSDHRIILIRAPHAGLVAALNLGFSRATGKYIARMDADDIARSDRLDIQIDHLDRHPATGLVCSDVRIIDAHGKVVGHQCDTWANRDALRSGLLFRTQMKPIIHPSVMMRREVVEKLGGYRSFDAAEDRDFWLRALNYFEFDRIGQELLDYRIHPGGISREKGAKQEVSGAMAAVNWLVQQELNIDTFREHPNIFSAAHIKMTQRVVEDILPAALEYRAARANIRSGKRLSGAVALAFALVRHGSAAMPDGARRAKTQVVEEIAAQISAHLTGREQAWII